MSTNFDKSPPCAKNSQNSSREKGDDPPEVKLPPKMLRDENGIQAMYSLPCKVNGYEIRLSGAIPKVYQHELKFYAIDDKGKEKDLSRGPKNDVSNILRHETLYETFKLLLETYKIDFGITNPDDYYRFVYDCGINFYSSVKLLNKGEEKGFILSIEKLSDQARDYLSKRYTKIKGVLLATEIIDLQSTSAVEEDLKERDRSVVQFMEIFSSQHLYNRTSYYVFQQKMFKKKDRIKMKEDPRIVKSGMQKNIRFVGDSIQKSHPLLQIDPKKSAFYDESDLLRYLLDFYNCNERELERRMKNSREQRPIARELRGLVVKTKHLNKNVFFSIHNVTEDGADQLYFKNRDGYQTTVSEYFEKKYHTRLRYPSLPCVSEKRFSKFGNEPKESYYPIEVLAIHEGQRVPFQKMTPALTEQMIRNCQMPPCKYEDEIDIQRSNAKLCNEAPHFLEYGIKIDPCIRSIRADVLFPPAIKYRNSVVELPTEDKFGSEDVTWKLDRKIFVKGAQVKSWAAVLFQKGIPPKQCNDFVNQLINLGNQVGMQIPKPKGYDELASTDIEDCRDRMKFYKSVGVEFIMFFTRDKLDPVHHVMKLLEVETGVITQHICKNTVTKAVEGRGANLVYGNVLMKMNMKLGGINNDLITSNNFSMRNRVNDNIVKNMWLKESRMFLGIEMSHASPQSLYERQAGIPTSEPTIVGMAYTVGESSTNLRGTYWCQKPLSTVIGQLADKIVTAMENYHGTSGAFPAHLVLYRSGISEGEFEKVLKYEKSYFDDAFESMAKKYGGFRKPELTIIIIQRTSNYRVLQERIDSRDPAYRQNVPSGTVIDREVMHPSQTEFLLVAQKAIQGTAHPIKCTVVYNNANLSLEDLEYMSYSLCFGHAIVNSPVSVPSPLYSAADLAKRGRNNWKEWNYGNIDGSFISAEGVHYKNPGDPEFFIKLSENLKPIIIHTKFWA